MNERSVKRAVGRMQSADTCAADANDGVHPPYGSSVSISSPYLGRRR
jgi:hypothetical protein